MAGMPLECNCEHECVIPSALKLRGVDKRTSPNEAQVVTEPQTSTAPQSLETAPPQSCIRCSRETKNFLELVCECERVLVNSGEPSWITSILMFIFGAILGRMYFFTGGSDPIELGGRETVYKTPLPLCDQCYFHLPHAHDLLPLFSKIVVVLGIVLCLLSPYFLIASSLGLGMMMYSHSVRSSRKQELSRMLTRSGQYGSIVETFPDLVIHEINYKTGSPKK